MTLTSIASYAEYNQAKIVAAEVDGTLYPEAAIQAFLNYASDYFESQCYQSIRLQEYIEAETLGTLYCSVDPNGWLNVFPRRFPIVEVTELAYRLTPAATWTVIDEDLYSVNDQGRIIVPYGSILNPLRYAEVRTTYTAGFSQSAPDAMPGDCKYAVILLSAFFASAGYAAVDINGETAKAVVPKWAWDIIDMTIQKYGRQF